MTDTADHKVKPYSPSAEYRYFLYDPYDGHAFYRTPEERDAAAESSIKEYLSDGEWNEGVVDIYAGEVTHQVNEVERLERVGQLDDDGYDENGEYWEDSDVDYKCNYALQPLAQSAPVEPATPIDLDALLSPAGPYESGPDAAMADGSQLVRDQHGNPTWWAPLHGCDSLDGLLFRIRSRILPHLRPPVIGIDIPGPDGDWGNIVDLCQAEGVEVEAGARLLRRARAAWGQGRFTPPAPDESAEHIRDATEMVAPLAEGDYGPSIEQLAPLITWLTDQCDQAANAGRSADAGMLLWAAQVVGECVDEDAPDSTPPVDGKIDAGYEYGSMWAGHAVRPEYLQQQQPTPPAEGEAWEQVVWLRSLIGESVWFEPGSENASKLAHAAYVLLNQSDQIAELQRQLNRRTRPNG